MQIFIDQLLPATALNYMITIRVLYLLSQIVIELTAWLYYQNMDASVVLTIHVHIKFSPSPGSSLMLLASVWYPNCRLITCFEVFQGGLLTHINIGQSLQLP